MPLLRKIFLVYVKLIIFGKNFKQGFSRTQNICFFKQVDFFFKFWPLAKLTYCPFKEERKKEKNACE